MRRRSEAAAVALPLVEEPRWEREATELLRAAQRRVHLIASATPTNLPEELASLERELARGRRRAPRFRYDSPEPGLDALERQLSTRAERLERSGDLGLLYAARARELALEARMCNVVGTRALAPLARRRYAARDEHDTAADELARLWLAERVERPRRERVQSDDASDPRSLLRRMQAEVGRAHLPMRVVVSDRLSALAATGAGVLLIAAGVELTVDDVERTVLHEIHGHALPRVRAQRALLGLFACGTARGSDDQEGRALALEEERGHLGGARRRELALRHVAARSVEAGADFFDTTTLLAEHQAPLGTRLRIAARAHRGGGLAREAVYLPALLRVRAARAADASVDGVLACGRIAVDTAAKLLSWIGPD